MPLALAIIGVGLLVTAILNTWRCLGTQLASDLSGSGNFIYWIAALFIIGMLGYNKTLETPSRLLLTLIILSMFLANQGFFSQFLSALKSVKGTGGTQQPEGQVQSAAPILIQGSASGSSGVGSAVSSAISLGSKLL
jgi:hypothetical protein